MSIFIDDDKEYESSTKYKYTRCYDIIMIRTFVILSSFSHPFIVRDAIYGWLNIWTPHRHYCVCSILSNASSEAFLDTDEQWAIIVYFRE